MELVPQGAYGVSKKSLPMFRVINDRNAASVWILRSEKPFYILLLLSILLAVWE